MVTPEDEIDNDLSINVASVVIQCISWVISNTEVGNDLVKDLRMAEIERFAANDQECKDLAIDGIIHHPFSILFQELKPLASTPKSLS